MKCQRRHCPGLGFGRFSVCLVPFLGRLLFSQRKVFFSWFSFSPFGGVQRYAPIGACTVPYRLPLPLTPNGTGVHVPVHVPFVPLLVGIV